MNVTASVKRAMFDIYRAFFGNDVFISYSYEAGAYVTALSAKLRETGLRIYHDQTVGEHGAPLSKLLREARRSRSIVVVLTAAAVKSPWVQAEVDAHATAPGTTRIIPVADDSSIFSNLPAPLTQAAAYMGVREPAGNIEKGIVSVDTVPAILRSFRYVRQRLLWWSSAAAALLTTAAWVSYSYTDTNQLRLLFNDVRDASLIAAGPAAIYPDPSPTITFCLAAIALHRGHQVIPLLAAISDSTSRAGARSHVALTLSELHDAGADAVLSDAVSDILQRPGEAYMGGRDALLRGLEIRKRWQDRSKVRQTSPGPGMLGNAGESTEQDQSPAGIAGEIVLRRKVPIGDPAPEIICGYAASGEIGKAIQIARELNQESFFFPVVVQCAAERRRDDVKALFPRLEGLALPVSARVTLAQSVAVYDAGLALRLLKPIVGMLPAVPPASLSLAAIEAAPVLAEFGLIREADAAARIAAQSGTLDTRTLLQVASWLPPKEALTRMQSIIAGVPAQARTPARFDAAWFLLQRKLFSEARAMVEPAVAELARSNDESIAIVAAETGYPREAEIVLRNAYYVAQGKWQDEPRTSRPDMSGVPASVARNGFLREAIELAKTLDRDQRTSGFAMVLRAARNANLPANDLASVMTAVDNQAHGSSRDERNKLLPWLAWARMRLGSLRKARATAAEIDDPGERLRAYANILSEYARQHRPNFPWPPTETLHPFNVQADY